MPRAYALIRSATLHGYGPLARSLGLDPAAMLRAAGLPADCEHDPEIPVRVQAVRRLRVTSLWPMRTVGGFFRRPPAARPATTSVVRSITEP